MESFKKTILDIEEDNFNLKQLVSILVLIVSKLKINTISETARLEGKTPRGIKVSKNYTKLMIGKARLVITGLKEDSFPF